MFLIMQRISSRRRLTRSFSSAMKSRLKDLGLFEEGMSLDEMQNIIQILDDSIQQETNEFKERLDYAAYESELDLHFHPSDVVNSTMLSDVTSSVSNESGYKSSFPSDVSTIELNKNNCRAEKIIVFAEVHHRQDSDIESDTGVEDLSSSLASSYFQSNALHSRCRGVKVDDVIERDV